MRELLTVRFGQAHKAKLHTVGESKEAMKPAGIILTYAYYVEKRTSTFFSTAKVLSLQDLGHFTYISAQMSERTNVSWVRPYCQFGGCWVLLLHIQAVVLRAGNSV